MLFGAYFHFVKLLLTLYSLYTAKCYMLRIFVAATIILSFSKAITIDGEPGRRNSLFDLVCRVFINFLLLLPV